MYTAPNITAAAWAKIRLQFRISYPIMLVTSLKLNTKNKHCMTDFTIDSDVILVLRYTCFASENEPWIFIIVCLADCIFDIRICKFANSQAIPWKNIQPWVVKQLWAELEFTADQLKLTSAQSEVYWKLKLSRYRHELELESLSRIMVVSWAWSERWTWYNSLFGIRPSCYQ